MGVEKSSQPALWIEVFELFTVAEIDEHRMAAATLPRRNDERRAALPRFDDFGHDRGGDGRMIRERDQRCVRLSRQCSDSHSNRGVHLAILKTVNDTQNVQVLQVRADFFSPMNQHDDNRFYADAPEITDRCFKNGLVAEGK